MRIWGCSTGIRARLWVRTLSRPASLHRWWRFSFALLSGEMFSMKDFICLLDIPWQAARCKSVIVLGLHPHACAEAGVPLSIPSFSALPLGPRLCSQTLVSLLQQWGSFLNISQSISYCEDCSWLLPSLPGPNKMFLHGKLSLEFREAEKADLISYLICCKMRGREERSPF